MSKLSLQKLDSFTGKFYPLRNSLLEFLHSRSYLVEVTRLLSLFVSVPVLQPVAPSFVNRGDFGEKDSLFGDNA